MGRKKIKIGEHVFHVHDDSNETTEVVHRNFQDTHIEDLRTDMTIQLKSGYGVPFVDYNVKITEKANDIFFNRADYLIQVDRNFRFAIISFHDQLALKHALMNLYSSFIVHHNWGLLIHSSCAVEAGKAHMFSGRSGAGKSTVAKLSDPRELLSDEATIVKIHEDEVTVFDSPFRSELETRGSERFRPLASIQLLHQGPVNRREQLKKADALMSLMDKVFYWPYCPDETRRIMAFLKTLVDAVPVYNLLFQKNNAFWELIS